MELIISIATFISVFLFLWGLYWGLSEQKRRIEHRMKLYTGKLTESPWSPVVKHKEEVPKWQIFLRRIGTAITPKKRAESLEAELIQAGIPLRGEEFIAIQLGSTIGFPVLLLVLSQNLAGALVFALLGYIIPKTFISRGKAKRAQKFNDQLVDALTVMANSLRAGFSFMQAMDVVTREMPSPISDEFSRALREMNLGKSADEAMEKMARRVDSQDLDLVITAVLIQRQVGGNLSEILDTIAETIRQRIRIKGQIRTLTAQGRMSGMVIGLLPVAMGALLLVISPDYMKPFYTEKLGLILLGAGAFSEIIGFMFIRKITNIDV